MMIVPTLCVGMPPRTLRVRSRMWRRCVPKLQRYPRHAPGSPNPQSVPFVTRSVTEGMPTRSIGTIINPIWPTSVNQSIGIVERIRPFIFPEHRVVADQPFLRMPAVQHVTRRFQIEMRRRGFVQIEHDLV